MGNTLSAEDIEMLLKQQDSVSGCADALMDYVINLLIDKNVLDIPGPVPAFANTSKNTSLLSGLPGISYVLISGSMAERLNFPPGFCINEQGELVISMPDFDGMYGRHADIVDTNLKQTIENSGFCFLETINTYPGFGRIIMRTVPHISYKVVKRSESGKDVTYLSDLGLYRREMYQSGPAVTASGTFHSNYSYGT